jgi:hypothetical protein
MKKRSDKTRPLPVSLIADQFLPSKRPIPGFGMCCNTGDCYSGDNSFRRLARLLIAGVITEDGKYDCCRNNNNKKD